MNASREKPQAAQTSSRRVFLKHSAMAAAAGLSAALPGEARESHQETPAAAHVAANDGRKPLRLGLILGVAPDCERAMATLRDLGLPSCQAYLNEFSPELATRLRAALDKSGIEATSLVVGGPGKEVWDFYGGPQTIGLVPRETREARLEHIRKASDFASRCGIPAVQTHCGFIPENPNDPVYRETIAAMREAAGYVRRNGQNFRYETGQETPITLVRAMRDVGLDNQGVNFDLANLILYGKANPVDAIEILGPYVQGIHAKDGLWPTNPRELGEEVPIGQGKVDFPRIIRRLKELRYQGAVTIEREVSGPRQIEDVRAAKVYLEKLIG